MIEELAHTRKANHFRLWLRAFNAIASMLRPCPRLTGR